MAAALPALVALAVAWPALVRPLLQGDSLGYHLPNAAAWTHDGTLWLTTTRYWWYPGGSELFAAGLLATAGPLAAGLAGTVASLLIGQRLVAWLRAEGVRDWVAGALAAAAVAIPAAALQAGNLENDLWLAAFVLEILWAARYEPGATARSAALCVLLKPYGALDAAVALVASRAPLRAWLGPALAWGVWFGRDALLWGGALIPPASTAVGGVFGTTIAAHGAGGALTLSAALLGDGAWTLLLFAAGIAGLVFSRDTALRLAAAATLLIFLFEPFGYDNPLPQLASGASLRYALPFLMLGALALAPLARRFPLACGAAALLASVAGCLHVGAIFANDATTHGTWIVLLVACAVFAAVALARGRFAQPGAALLAMGLAAYAVTLAGSHPIDYYEDMLGAPGEPSRFFSWLDEHEPSAVVGWHVRLGAIEVVSPGTRGLDGLEADPCGEAARAHALLVAGDDPPSTPPERARNRDRALDCGPALYRDPAVVVVAPR